MITDHKAKSEHKSNLALAIVHSNNSRIFQYILSIKGNDQYPTPIFYNYKQASTDSDKAQLFNEYFYSVYTSTKQQINDCERTASPDMLQDITISETEVFEILTSLDSSKHVESTSVQSYSKTVLHLYSKLFVTCFPQVYNATLSHWNGVPIVWSLFTKPGTSHLYPISTYFLTLYSLQSIVKNCLQ